MTRWPAGEDQSGSGYSGQDVQAWFTADQPSTQLSSFGIPEVAAVGRELDQKLAQLLQALDVDVPSSLRDRPAA